MSTNYHLQNECYFDDLESKIRKELYAAKQSIRICVAWINLSRFQDILIQKLIDGVTIQILCNHDIINTKQSSKTPKELLGSILLIKNPIKNRLMHHKFCIIDDHTLITGSYNWSKSAHLHYENIVIIRNDFRVVNKFKHEFYDLLYMASLTLSEFKSIVVRPKFSKLNLGIISNQHGNHESCTLTIWEVNLAKNDYKRLDEIDVPYFFSSISFDNDIDDFGDEKIHYQEVFKSQRQYSESIQDFFKGFNKPVHAIGSAIISNFNEVTKHGGFEERVFNLFWIDMRLTKVIPENIEATGKIETIWMESYYP